MLENLNNQRCIRYKEWHALEDDCQKKCGHHLKNNTEIHYRFLDRLKSRYEIAQNWMNFLIDQGLLEQFFKFRILGVNLSNIDFNSFGGKKGSDLTIYNRFFRSVLKGSINYFYGRFKRIVIHEIYHHVGSQMNHKLFSWHALYKLSEEDNMEFLTNRIKFINSDHRKSEKEESHLIQLIDLILGATVINLHDQSSVEAKRKIGLLFQPLLQIILNRKRKKRNNFGKYYKDKRVNRNCEISFFPLQKNLKKKKKIQIDLHRNPINEKYARDSFYYDRKILLRDSNNQNLSPWIEKIN